jgi:hypothetical protein
MENMMFRTADPAVETPVVFRDESPVPLSALQLDLPEVNLAYLHNHGVEVVEDDIGRLSVSKADARRLFDEKRDNDARAREVAARQERQFIEADEQRRAQLPRGVPWYEIPDGVLPAVAMTAADKAAQPRRTPSQTEWLFGEVDNMVFNSLEGTDEAS